MLFMLYVVLRNIPFKRVLYDYAVLNEELFS